MTKNFQQEHRQGAKEALRREDALIFELWKVELFNLLTEMAR